MLEQENLAEIEEHLAAESRSHRAFFVPIVRAIAALGGRARKREVVKKIRELLAGVLSEKQLDYLEANERFAWARMNLKQQGLIGGEYGFWELTPLGREYERSHATDELQIDLDIPEAKVLPASTVPTESVDVTAFGAYEIPSLEVMATGLAQKREILGELERRLDQGLLPGDKREMPNGTPVWRFRAHWAFSSLAKAGHAENVSTGQWKITEAGRERLEREREGWDFAAFHGSKAKVRILGEKPPPLPPDPPVLPAWTQLRGRIGKVLFDQIDARLRPGLGPSPDSSLPRNVILYGPPGTGKTYLAKEVARALTGQEALAEEGRFRLVQFHPSYAYEDFVQGLRPDIKQTQLRYQISKGPFLRVAEDAAQEPDAFYVLVIDEINRGDPARIFGELLYALEYRNEPVELPLGGELLVPPNLIIIGTMNSVDRSVALVDYALRRRFGFVRVDPDPSVVADAAKGVLAELGPDVLDRFNAWLTKRLGREHAIGHSFFLSPSLPDDADDAFEQLWRLDVGPLLEEYFFGDPESVGEAERQWRAIVAEARSTREEVRADEETEAAG